MSCGSRTVSSSSRSSKGLTAQLNGVEHANFFETRATEYAKAATGGAWHGEAGAWGLFDRRVSRRVQRELLGPTAHT
jgi:ribonucleoside-diphosphate reductase beta chain